MRSPRDDGSIGAMSVREPHPPGAPDGFWRRSELGLSDPVCRRAARAAVVVCCVGASAMAASEPERDGPHPFRGTYEGRTNIALMTATARAEIDLRRTTRFIRYTMHSTVTWSFLERRFRDCSVIRLEGGRMWPLEFVHVDESKPALDVHTVFDWQNQQATTTLGHSPAPTVLAIDWPTWDPMSYQVALIGLAQRARPGDRETHHVIERGALKQHRVSVSGPVPFISLGRPVQALEMVSQKDKGSVTLLVSSESPLRPLRIVLDDVAIDLAAEATGTAAAALPPGEVPRCGVREAP